MLRRVTTMRTVGAKLFLAIAMPALVAALLGVIVLWRQTDLAMRDASKTQALQLAQFIATSFSTVDETPAGAPPRTAHRAVTNAIRSDWSTLTVVTELRVLDRQGVVRWSRRVEEEDKPTADAKRVIAVPKELATFASPDRVWPWSGGAGGEVILPLGGVACAGCHAKDAAMRTGTIQLSVDEPTLRAQVSEGFRRAFSMMLLFLLIMTAAVAVSLRLVLTNPIGRLAAVMRRAEAGDLVVRAPEYESDEVGRLGHAFNQMLARLTEMKATEIDTKRDLDLARVELSMKTELEAVNGRLTARIAELQILYDNARTLSSTLELGAVLDQITHDLPKRLNVPRFSLMLLTPAGRLEVRNAFPDDPGQHGVGFAVGEGVCGHAAALRKSVYVPDVSSEARFTPSHRAAPARGSLLSVPMIQGGEVVGVLNFERDATADFSADEIEFFTAVTSQVAMAVKNARLHEQTVALSVTDPLTGVPNRRFLFQQLEAEVARSKRFDTPVSLVMIDIDHFKQLNDSQGHVAGDETLKQVCAVLKKSVRRVDTLARYGGEEFAVVLPQVARAEALEVAEKLRYAIETAPLTYGATQPLGHVTISVGVATLPTDAGALELLVDHADSALYASKRAGRNKVHGFSKGMEVHPGRERGPKSRSRA